MTCSPSGKFGIRTAAPRTIAPRDNCVRKKGKVEREPKKEKEKNAWDTKPPRVVVAFPQSFRPYCHEM